jgi:hypothetical protein
MPPAVQEEYLRVVEERRRQAEPLPHAPGEAPGGLLYLREAHVFQQLGDPGAGALQLIQFRKIFQVLFSREVAIKPHAIRQVPDDALGLHGLSRHVDALDVARA